MSTQGSGIMSNGALFEQCLRALKMPNSKQPGFSTYFGINTHSLGIHSAVGNRTIYHLNFTKFPFSDGQRVHNDNVYNSINRQLKVVSFRWIGSFSFVSFALKVKLA